MHNGVHSRGWHLQRGYGRRCLEDVCHCIQQIRKKMWVPLRNGLTADEIRKKYSCEERGTYSNFEDTFSYNPGLIMGELLD